MTAMLHEVFYWVLNMSITAAVTGLPVMLIRRIKKIPRRFVVFLWLIPFLRMAVPLGVNSPYSLMSLLSRVASRAVVVYEPAEDVAFSMMNSVVAADAYFPITYKSDALRGVFNAASVAWLAVSLALLLTSLLTYCTTLRALKGATRLKDDVYLLEDAASPAVYGIVKPKIVLPANCARADIGLIVLHEKTHVRSGDNLWRVLALALACVHWFSPLSWSFLQRLLEDIELSCDERVLTSLGDGRKKEYAAALLRASGRGTTLFVSPFGGAKLRTRLENILSFRRATRLSLAAFALFAGMLFYVSLTNA